MITLIIVALLAGIGALDPRPFDAFGRYGRPDAKGGMLLQSSPGDIGFGDPVSRAHFEASYYGDAIARVKITDSAHMRWQVPHIVQLPVAEAKSLPSPSAQLHVVVNSDASGSFGMDVRRASSGADPIFNAGGLVFADRYLRLHTSLPADPVMYGIGEHVTSFKLPMGLTWSLMASDQGTPVNRPLYGSHPFYMELRDDGIAHGVFLLNSNPMEIELQQGKLTYRAIGGVFDLWFFAGPTPALVMQQYHSVIGRPMLPPAWHFGFHQCRWGYRNLDMVIDVVDKYEANDIPLDTIWNDIDYMDGFRVFTLDPTAYPLDRVQNFIEKIHSSGRHYIPIIDPGVKIDTNYATFVDGVADDVFLRSLPGAPTPNGYYVAQVWPGLVHFPDWTHPNTTSWWMKNIDRFHSDLKFDGLWTDMNEVSNFFDGRCIVDAASSDCTGFVDTGNWDTPWPASGRQPIRDRFCHSSYGPGLDCGSVSMAVQHHNGARELHMHNLFGHLESVATHASLEHVRGTRAVVLTRSTFPGTGRYASHWLGDNDSSFESMRASIAGMLSMGLFGIPMVGADVCGFGGDTTPELCLRWFQLGMWYPFARNHNSLWSQDQEAYKFEDSVKAIIRTAIRRRYTMHHYFYTVAAQAAIAGGAIARAVMMEFPEDRATWALDLQFMIGSAIMVCPQVYPLSSSVSCYLPATVQWYDSVSGARAVTSTTIPTPLDTIPVYIRGGSIIPMSKKIGLTVKETRQNDINLLVALDEHGAANGTLYLDDTDSIDSISAGKFFMIHFQAIKTAAPIEHLYSFRLRSTSQGAYQAKNMRLGAIDVYPPCPGQLIVSQAPPISINELHLDMFITCDKTSFTAQL